MFFMVLDFAATSYIGWSLPACNHLFDYSYKGTKLF